MVHMFLPVLLILGYKFLEFQTVSLDLFIRLTLFNQR